MDGENKDSNADYVEFLQNQGMNDESDLFTIRLFSYVKEKHADHSYSS